jgi:probable HAF family extracellular repeat protein
MRNTLGAMVLVAWSGCALAQTYTLNDLGTLGGSNSFANGISNNGEISAADGRAKYKVDILRNVPGGTYTVASAINNHGQIAGTAYGPSECGPSAIGCAATWSGTTPTLLGAVPNALLSEASGINDRGEVVGSAVIAPGVPFDAIVWNHGTPTVLNHLPAPDSLTSVASAINNAGLIVGNSDSGYGNQAVVWNGITPTSLAASCSAANGINGAGQIVGNISNCSEGGIYTNYALLFNGAITIELPTLGESNSSAVSINDSLEIVGYSTTLSGAQHAAYWDHARVLDLGTLGGESSAAAGINAQGDVVGWADTTSQGSHAAYWHKADSKPVDLNTEIGEKEKAQITLTDAVAINDRCVIVANGYDNKTGVAESFVLSPKSGMECKMACGHHAHVGASMPNAYLAETCR